MTNQPGVPDPGHQPKPPKAHRGGLVAFPDPKNLQKKKVIVFQYNPETVTRSLQQQGTEFDWRSNAGDTEHTTLPLETLNMTVELDAADQLESAPHGDPKAGGDVTPLQFGLHPSLLALELLLYPSFKSLEKAHTLEQKGQATVAPGVIPMVMLVLGKNRVLPVRLTSLSITEELFDTFLNPIQARVELSVRSLTVRELRAAGTPWNQFVLDQVNTKENLARRDYNTEDDKELISLIKLPTGGG